MALRAQKLQMGQNKITGVADATDDADAVNLLQMNAAITDATTYPAVIQTFLASTTIAQAQDNLDVVPGTDVEKLGQFPAINTQTASYTLVIGDKGKVVEMNVATANNLTIPPNSSVAFPVTTIINVTQVGAGQTTFVAGTGVTIRNRQGYSPAKLNGQWSMATLYKRATDEWVLGGDITS